MTRRNFIEQTLRQLYNGQPTNDANITYGLVNQYLSQGIGIAAKNSYKENYQIEGIGFVNNSFYTTFKGLAITPDEFNLYKFTLPEIPVGIGASEGISRFLFKDSNNTISYPGVMLTENQVGIQRQMRLIPNKIICYYEGSYGYAITTIAMTNYTASVTMISGGDSTNLDSILNVPSDFIPVIVEYIKAQLSFEKAQKQDVSNDGATIV